MEAMYYGLRETGCEVRTRAGLKILVRCWKDLYPLEEVYVHKVYDQKPVRVPPNGVVLDVGAHIGTFSLYAAKAYKAKKVYSFEPCPKNYATLKMNVQNNGLSNIVIPIPKAIDAQTGTRELFLDPRGDLFHSFYFSGQQTSTVKVECITLKQAIKENGIDHVDYLKMDCEGAEWEILETMDKETLSKISTIGMEYHLKPREDFVKLLDRLGFNVLNLKEEWRNRTYILAIKKT
jgi:FkbM family methyltransferase